MSVNNHEIGLEPNCKRSDYEPIQGANRSPEQACPSEASRFFAQFPRIRMRNNSNFLKGGPALRTLTAVALAILLSSNCALLEAAEPKEVTLRSWDDYINILSSDMEKRAAGQGTFLFMGESPGDQLRARRGELIVTSHDPRRVPQGLIHHWIGGMFVPNVTLDQVVNVLSSYDRLSEFYKPLVRKSTVLERDGDTARLSVIVVQKAFSVTAAVETEDQVQITRLAPNRAYIKCNAVRVQEIADYGQSSQHPFQEDRRPGYVWRASVFNRVEEHDGGVYVELETVALSRGIPLEVRWLIKPLTDELPRKMMVDMLNDTRTAIQHEAESSPADKLAQRAAR